MGLGILVFNSPMVFAQEPDTKNSLPIKANPTATLTSVCTRLEERDYSQLIHATCYSERHQAVVIMVSGNAKGVSGQKIGQHIASEFEKSFVPSVVFLENPKREKVAISYLLNGDFYGPYSGHNWKEGKKILMLHSAQAWHQNIDGAKN